ncbi:MAG: hypothetical protein JWR06_2041 [Jatrophihabitans sp.]|jgi:hypothetical protein|nr:hypothetical protein [Jatrophihabitans sp.]MDT4903075.1 hypothetical protein [Pseudonocardiales bacterium]MDT4931722.1 hypothetical protein [Pseudonocardiales bacterium]
MTPDARSVLVRGNASAEELAAVLAVVVQAGAPEPDGYTRWRRTRLAALSRERAGHRTR